MDTSSRLTSEVKFISTSNPNEYIIFVDLRNFLSKVKEKDKIIILDLKCDLQNPIKFKPFQKDNVSITIENMIQEITIAWGITFSGEFSEKELKNKVSVTFSVRNK